MFAVRIYEKSGFSKQSFGIEISKVVLKMSVKLKFKFVCFEKKHCFALVALNWLPICFY